MGGGIYARERPARVIHAPFLKIALVIGTRPEAIKLAPVYHALEAAGAEPIAILTGQHDAVLDPLIRHFALERRLELGVRGRRRPLGFAGRCLAALGPLFEQGGFAAALVQGDTTSALAGALGAAYCRLPVGHVEAGLRTAGIDSPFPEELNRRMIAEAARWHFAPTTGAADNLRREGHQAGIHVVGNTVVDAALWTAGRSDRDALERLVPGVGERPFVLVTAHRRESFGRPMAEMAAAVEMLAGRHAEIEFIVPLHPNPRAAAPFAERLADIDNVRLTAPLPYPAMIALVARARMILTDSGGLQEEGPSFGVPVLVMREETERPEGLAAGCSRLAGTGARSIVAAFGEMLAATTARPPGNPYGDGQSAPRIAGVLMKALGESERVSRSVRTAARAR